MLDDTQIVVATPYLANVLVPVLNVPANLNVTPEPASMLIEVVELLYIDIVCPKGLANIPELIVTLPVVMETICPLSAAVNT